MTDDLIVSGSISQYLHLKKLHRHITDLDIVLFNDFALQDNLESINRILSTNYTVTSYKDNGTYGRSLKISKSDFLSGKEIKTYVSFDIKQRKELYVVDEHNLKLVIFEQLMSNKLASAIVRNNIKRYVRIKDFYDLNFLLTEKPYDYDLLIQLLCKDLAKNGITNIYDSFLLKDGNEHFYRALFEQLKEKYGMNEPIDLFMVRNFVLENADNINNQLARTISR